MTEPIWESLSPSAASVAFRESLRTLTLQRITSFREELSGLPRDSPRYKILLEELLLDAQALENSGNANMLRAERNAHTTTLANLPSEVLSTVFSLCAEIDRPVAPIDRAIRNAFERDDAGTEWAEPSGQWFSEKSGRLGCIYISHVCSHWRRLIVHSPLLWAKEVGTLPSAVHTMLNRAGSSCPLTVSTTGSSFRQDNFVVWEILLAEGGAVAQRVREIYCSETRSMYLGRYLLPLIRECKMPILEKFVVFANENEIGVGDVLLDLVAPRLQAVHLTSSSLSSLSICLAEVLDILDTWWLLEEHLYLILHQCKATLTHLNLDIQIPVNLSDDRSPFQRSKTPLLVFPKLATLRYCDQLNFGFFHSDHPIPLFACISYPQSTLTVVDVHVTRQSPPVNYELLFSSLLKAGTPSPHGLAIDDRADSAAHTLSIGVFVAPTGMDNSRPGEERNRDPHAIFGKGTHRLTLKLSSLPAGSLLAMLTGLTRCVPSSKVQTLSYSSFCSSCVQNFVCTNFTAVQTLQIVDPHEGRGRVLLESLCRRTPSGDYHWHMLRTLYLVRHAKWPQDRHLFLPQNDEIVHRLSQRWSIVTENASSTLEQNELKVIWRVIWDGEQQ
ncbi:hypothetical protein PENSPDRAFT_755368 [Peniophora sp. CONT]|nr:hypothetical protein PENSPDRAFT_755368 [Peniophora sp. CONT]